MGLWNWEPAAIYLNIKANGIKGVTDAPVIENYKTQEHDGKFYWDLIWITVREKSDVNKYETVQMEFIDEKQDRYVVSTTFTWLATSIINSLAWWVDRWNTFKNMCISLYSKDDYARVWLFSDGDMMSWKHDIKDLLAKTKKVKVNWEDVTDREELNEFLKEEIVKINEYLMVINWDNKNAPVASVDDLEEETDFGEQIEKEVEEKWDKKVNEVKPAKSDDDDLPF